MTRDEYVKLLTDLLSGDPSRVRDANRKLYECCIGPEVVTIHTWKRQADLVLAEIAG